MCVVPAGKPSVLDLSWSFEPDEAFTRAALSVVVAGIHVVGAAGNYGQGARLRFSGDNE